MAITNVTLRHSKKGEVETTIIEFHLSERERPYSLYVNNFTDIEGLKNQLSGLAHIIPPVEAAEQSVQRTGGKSGQKEKSLPTDNDRLFDWCAVTTRR